MKTIVITGANRGIGLALAGLFRDRGDQVIAVCRDSSPQLEALGVQIKAGVDVTSGDSLRRLAACLDDTRIDVLVNNAGVMRKTDLEHIEQQLDDYRVQFEVNALAPLRVTSALLGRLSDDARVVIVSSRMGSLSDNSSAGHYGYRVSKAAANMAGVTLAHELKDKGIAVGLLHPGYVKTDMTGNTGDIDPLDAARGLIGRIDELTLENAGGFYHANGEKLPW
ncbi:MAG: SDR family oxidoreductase [Xanthomonadaceae bacterium]|nr:SDR family oxidoreductase [Xanthomonadaceae bacterium]